VQRDNIDERREKSSKNSEKKAVRSNRWQRSVNSYDKKLASTTTKKGSEHSNEKSNDDKMNEKNSKKRNARMAKRNNKAVFLFIRVENSTKEA